jgi:hypothetical protein
LVGGWILKPNGLSGGFLNTVADGANIPAEAADGAATRAEDRRKSGCEGENGNVFE